MNNAISLINLAALKSVRSPAQWRPPKWAPERGLYVGFLENWDEERIRFYSTLLKCGFNAVFYNAPYHWALEKDGVRIDYVEGDIYVKSLQTQNSK